MTIRAGVTEAGQPGNFGAITGVDTADFSLDAVKTPFNIKNNTEINITLSVRPAGGGAFVDMLFYPGWNVEIVSEIETDAGVSDTDLSWGS